MMSIDELPALSQRHRMRIDGLDVLELADSEKAVFDVEIRFADDEDIFLQKKIRVDGHGAGDRVLDGQDAEIGRAFFHRIENLLARRESAGPGAIAEMTPQSGFAER